MKRVMHIYYTGRDAGLSYYTDLDGWRLTDCCHTSSTEDRDGDLHCDRCGDPVGLGEGDGTERFDLWGVADEAIVEEINNWRFGNGNDQDQEN